MLTTIIMSLTATLSPVDATATTNIVDTNKVEFVQVNENRNKSTKKLSFERVNENRNKSTKKLSFNRVNENRNKSTKKL